MWGRSGYNLKFLKLPFSRHSSTSDLEKMNISTKFATVTMDNSEKVRGWLCVYVYDRYIYLYVHVYVNIYNDI